MIHMEEPMNLPTWHRNGLFSSNISLDDSLIFFANYKVSLDQLYVCVCVYIYVYVYTYTSMYVCIYIYLYNII